MAINHGVSLIREPGHGEPFGFTPAGERILRASDAATGGMVRADRTAPDGSRLTLYWDLSLSPTGHLVQMGFLTCILAVVLAGAFWLLQRQLTPLASLHAGVEAFSRGDFKVRVSKVRDDEIGRVADAFNAMAARVGTMIEDRERLLADVSHELRSPMARMKVALELIPQGDERDSLARDIGEMEGLVAALLEREALEARASREPAREIDVAAIARDVAGLYAGRSPGVEVISRDAVRIRAEPSLVKLLVHNLVDNAVKFSTGDSRPVRVILEGGPEGAALRVEDDGIGIPAGSEEKVFEPFVKLDRARGHGTGHGLGLNLCQRITRRLGGTVRLEPRRPRGTVAVVALPESRGAEPHDPATG